MSWINIDASKFAHTSQHRPVHREYHEFSHYVMHTLYKGKWPEPVNPSVPEVNHGGYANPSTSDSFVEGFATFMAIGMFQTIGDTIPHSPVRVMDTLVEGRIQVLKELETNYKAWDRDGRAEELAVAGVLWDLLDTEEDYQLSTKNSQIVDMIFNESLDLYDLNQNGVMDRMELITECLMRFSSVSHDENYSALLNNEDLVLLLGTAVSMPAGEAELIKDGLIEKHDNHDLLTKYDTDSQGSLDKEELSVLVADNEEVIVVTKYTYANKLIKAYDQDGDRELDESELIKMLAGEELRRKVVGQYDLDADDYLSISEVAKMAKDQSGSLLADMLVPGSQMKFIDCPQQLTKETYLQLVTPHDDDDVEIPFSEIWAILRQYHQDFTAVYESFISKYPDQKEAIDEIFKAHGFFSDVNPRNQQWDAGEEIGRAADASTEERKMRRSIQPLPGQFIKVDNDVPYYDVAVLFPFQPHLSYVTRTSNDNGLVYVPVPPESYYALITVEAEGVETKNPLKFNTNLFNATYGDSVKQGYFMEYEFELEGEIPVLPSFSFDESDVSERSEDEATGSGSESDSGSGSNAAIIVVPIIVIAAIAAAAFVFLRRRRTMPVPAGGPVKPPSAESIKSPSETHCSKCGAPNAQGAAFCKKCGSNIDS